MGARNVIDVIPLRPARGRGAGVEHLEGQREGQALKSGLALAADKGSHSLRLAAPSEAANGDLPFP